MYVSQRASVDGTWGSPMNLGPAVNTTFDEGNPAFSRDGRLLFFQSKRLPSFGGIDIWVARRNNPHDDFDWQPAVNLGPGVNSSADDNGPAYFEDIARGTRQLYFGSTRTPGLGGADIYVSEQMADGSFGPAMLVPELRQTFYETLMECASLAAQSDDSGRGWLEREIGQESAKIAPAVAANPVAPFLGLCIRPPWSTCITSTAWTRTSAHSS